MSGKDNRAAKECRYYNGYCPDDTHCPPGAYCHKQCDTEAEK